jgi:hypothetical protein
VCVRCVCGGGGAARLSVWWCVLLAARPRAATQPRGRAALTITNGLWSGGEAGAIHFSKRTRARVSNSELTEAGQAGWPGGTGEHR